MSRSAILSRLMRWCGLSGHRPPVRRASGWQPIVTAPSEEHILLGWSEGDEEFDWLITAGELSDGRWLDGPGPQPDWWMSAPPYASRKPIQTAPNNQTLVLIWEDEDCYVFDVGELRDGCWLDGPEQPSGWIPVGRPPRTCHG